MNDDLERQFERLMRNPLTRRRILQRGAAGALSASALAYLAACGTDEPEGGGSDSEEAKAIPKGKIGDSLYIANWPLYIEEDRGTLKEFQEEYDGSQGQVRRRGQRQHRVLRQGPPAVRPGQLRRPRHPRRHGLDGRAHDPARLRPELRQVHDAEREREPDRAAEVAAVRPEARVLDAVAVGPRGDHLPQGQGEARAQVGGRPVRPGLQGQGHDADRDARHRRRRRGLDGRGPRERRASTSSWRRSTRSARAQTRARSAASPATSTRRTSPRATPG